MRTVDLTIPACVKTCNVRHSIARDKGKGGCAGDVSIVSGNRRPRQVFKRPRHVFGVSLALSQEGAAVFLADIFKADG
jgi:hypothetical protein